MKKLKKNPSKASCALFVITSAIALISPFDTGASSGSYCITQAANTGLCDCDPQGHDYCRYIYVPVPDCSGTGY